MTQGIIKDIKLSYFFFLSFIDHQGNVKARNMINNIFKNKIFQPKNKNLRALNYLKKLDYPLPRIRKALIVLNGIKLFEIAQDQISPVNISKTVSGLFSSKKAKRLISQKLDIKEDELF